MADASGFGPYTDEHWSAASKLQSLYRTRQARNHLRWLLRSVYEKVYDEETCVRVGMAVHTAPATAVSWKGLGALV